MLVCFLLLLWCFFGPVDCDLQAVDDKMLMEAVTSEQSQRDYIRKK